MIIVSVLESSVFVGVGIGFCYCERGLVSDTILLLGYKLRFGGVLGYTDFRLC